MATRQFFDTYETLAAALSSAIEVQGLTAEQVAKRARVDVSFIHDLQQARPQRQMGKTLDVLDVLDIQPYALPAPPPPARRPLRRAS